MPRRFVLMCFRFSILPAEPGLPTPSLFLRDSTGTPILAAFFTSHSLCFCRAACFFAPASSASELYWGGGAFLTVPAPFTACSPLGTLVAWMTRYYHQLVTQTQPVTNTWGKSADFEQANYYDNQQLKKLNNHRWHILIETENVLRKREYLKTFAVPPDSL